MIQQVIAQTPGKHVVAVPTHRLIDEYLDRLGRGNVYAFRSTEDGPSVASALNAERQRVEADLHAIFLITHDALLRSVDHPAFEGWNLWIDEALTLQNRATHFTPVSGILLDKLYDLKAEDGVKRSCQIVAKAGGDDDPVTVVDLGADTFASGLAGLHARVMNTREPVFTALRSWSDLEANPNWYTVSQFDVLRLSPFKRVHMFASGVTETVTYQLLSENPAVEITMVPMPARTWTQRVVTVNYFADQHVLSASALSRFAGTNISLIQEWCRNQPWCSTEGHFWMANKDIRIDLPGARLSPKSHGLNLYADRRASSVFYKSKPSLIERKLLRDSGVEEWRVIAEREYETIAQVVMRGSIRDPNSSEPFVATVYDHQQAQRLATYLTGSYGFRVEVQRVDLEGFEDREMDRRPIRKDVARSSSERAALKVRQKAENAERMREKRWDAAGKDIPVERRRWAERQAIKAGAA
ncbi:MAG: hypothetical protein K2Y04_12520 [Caulobacteraceae bacterium]|nr:hypothetical protein [Caulobacteraceae bacterium]